MNVKSFREVYLNLNTKALYITDFVIFLYASKKKLVLLQAPSSSVKIEFPKFFSVVIHANPHPKQATLSQLESEMGA